MSPYGENLKENLLRALALSARIQEKHGKQITLNPSVLDELVVQCESVSAAWQLVAERARNIAGGLLEDDPE